MPMKNDKKKPLYGSQLSEEWADWVEALNPTGTREAKIYPLISRWLKEIAPKSIVDIGCGQGICSSLMPNNTDYIGIDNSRHLLGKARKLYGNGKRVFKIGDAYSLPLKDASVDTALSLWVWSHLENLPKAAQEMARVLKPGGHYLVINANPETYNIRKTFYKSYKEENNLLIGTFDLGGGKVLSDTTLYLHSIVDIENAIRNASLTIDKISRIGRDKEASAGLYIAFGGTKYKT